MSTKLAHLSCKHYLVCAFRGSQLQLITFQLSAKIASREQFWNNAQLAPFSFEYIHCSILLKLNWYKKLNFMCDFDFQMLHWNLYIVGVILLIRLSWLAIFIYSGIEAYSILTQYHQASTNTNLNCFCLGITDFCTVYPGSCYLYLWLLEVIDNDGPPPCPAPEAFNQTLFLSIAFNSEYLILTNCH